VLVEADRDGFSGSGCRGSSKRRIVGGASVQSRTCQVGEVVARWSGCRGGPHPAPELIGEQRLKVGDRPGDVPTLSAPIGEVVAGGQVTGAAISTPELLFYFPRESINSLTDRWQDRMGRDATVATHKDQSQDTAGINREFLRTHLLLRPALTAVVAIASHA